MRVKILVVVILIALFTPVFIVHSTNNDSESFDSQDKKVVEIPESIGYCFPFDGIDLNYSSFPQLFYPLVTRQFFCDFHEKSEDFCVS